jgi:hypothetical protein
MKQLLEMKQLLVLVLVLLLMLGLVGCGARQGGQKGGRLG